MLIHVQLDGLELPEGITGVVLTSGSASSLALSGNRLLSEGNREFGFDIYETISGEVFPYKELVSGLPAALVTLSNLKLHSEDSSDLKAGFNENFKVVHGIVRATEPSCQKVDVTRKSDKFNVENLIELYNQYAEKNHWQKCRSITSEIKRYGQAAIKKLPLKEDWVLVFQGWESDPFFSGKSGVYDRIKIRTMFFKTRYMEFYEDGLALLEAPKKQTTEEWLAELHAKQEPIEEHARKFKESLEAFKAGR